MDLRPVRKLIRRQDGVATFAQLGAAGLTRGEIRAQVDALRWRRYGDRTVVAHNHVPTRRQLMWVAVLDPTGCVSLGGLTSLETAGFRFFGVEKDLVHLVVQRGAKTWAHPQVKVHESRRLDPRDLDPDSILPRTRLARSALDAAAWQPFPRYACALLAAVVQQRLCSPQDLEQAMRAVGRIRHKQHLRLALHDIAGGSEALSELDLVALCRRSSLQVPDRQVRRRERSGRVRYLDAEWRLPWGRVVLEVDGSHHMTAAHWESDIRRERQVVASGSVVLRATANEVRLAPETVVADLIAVGVPRC
ncbi:MAG: DUF559 domain-containing protein [Nocardioidaceae bacterium]